MNIPARLGVTAGVTNSRLSAAKRGVAVALGRQLARTTGAPVCVVGADPTDRDVDRCTPALMQSDREHAAMTVTNGRRTLRTLMLPTERLCLVSVPDRLGMEAVLPEIRATYPFVIVDGPSRIGTGIGIAPTITSHLDLLLVVTALTAEELAGTRGYVERLSAIVRAQHLDVRVAASGQPVPGELSVQQVDRRLGRLPTIARLPRVSTEASLDDVEDAYRPVVDWIREFRREAHAPLADPIDVVPTQPLVTARAAALYTANG